MIKKLGKLCGNPFFFSLFVLLGVTPLLFLMTHVYSEQGKISSLREELSDLKIKAETTHLKRLTKKQFLEKYTDFDPYFLNHHVETLSFLENENQIISQTLDHPIFCADKLLKKRKRSLDENQLLFREQNVQSTPIIKETNEVQVKRIEVSLTDIEKLLSEVEEVSLNNYTPSSKRPQIFLTNFSIHRIKKAPSSELYELDCEIFKREFLKKIKPQNNDVN